MDSARKRWMTYGVGTIAVVALGVLAAWGFRAFVRPDLKAETASAFAVLNQHLPARVDAQTLLERVTLDGRLITYHYALTGTRAAAMDLAVFRAGLELSLPGQVCANQSIRQFFEAGFSIRFRYVDEGRMDVGAFDFESADCGE